MGIMFAAASSDTAPSGAPRSRVSSASGSVCWAAVYLESMMTAASSMSSQPRKVRPLDTASKYLMRMSCVAIYQVLCHVMQQPCVVGPCKQPNQVLMHCLRRQQQVQKLVLLAQVRAAAV